MIIIYYKSKQTGEYTRVHGAHRDDTLEKLAPLVADYNARNDTRETVGTVEVADDSLEAYLMATRDRRANIDKDAIHDAIEALEDALYHVRRLED